MNIDRRQLLIAASGAGLAALAGAAIAPTARVQWNGFALGAQSRIIIAGLDRNTAGRLIAGATAEIERLENIFSLYRPQSELSRLNRTGRLDHPSHDFRLLLEQSLNFHTASEGAFNFAIQPVWTFLAQHFAQSQRPPSLRDLEQILRACDPTRLSVGPARIEAPPGMALTFNGIAQGYVTDAVANLFRAEGLRDILVNLGETRALPGKPWTVGLAGTDRHMALSNGAIAQSSGNGTIFSSDGHWHHLIDPRTGASANHRHSNTIFSTTATEADALSTALYVAPAELLGTIIARFPDARIIHEA